MQTKNYTSENICLAMGLDGFANDWHLAKADESIRVLLMPSFHPEVCLSFLKHGALVSIRVETAREQIWHQNYPTPQRALTDTAEGTTSIEEYFTLLELFECAANPPAGSRMTILDGMPTHSIYRRAGERVLNVEKNASAEATYKTFIGKAITVAWEGIADPIVRNALRKAGSYAGVKMPEQEVPPHKPKVRTVILGAESESLAILDALERHHKQPKPD